VVDPLGTETDASLDRMLPGRFLVFTDEPFNTPHDVAQAIGLAGRQG